MTEDVWYKDGLPFSCTQCGNCCTGSTGFVWVTEDDLLAIAEYLDKPIGEVRLLHTRPAKGKTSLREYPNGDCIYFDGNKRGCTIYPVRPIQCRTWPFWNSNLTDRAAWDQTEKDCPGAGMGAFIPVEEIQTLASKTDL